jgi:uncharacterized protein (TIGR04255 family)
MQDNTNQFPDYDNPPVIEVVCGVHFKSINNLLAPHLGLLWEKFKADYPNCREVAPLAPVIEEFREEKQFNIEFQEVPPLPRIWFIHKNNNGILQVQRDRFLHNWRKIKPEEEYPRYPKVIEMFKSMLSLFEFFLHENKFEKLTPLQYEMTYINHIVEGKGWSKLSEIGKVLPDFSFRQNPKRFLPDPEIINWRTSFLLPDEAGRMHVTIRNGSRKEGGEPLLLLDLTVRGLGNGDMESWFNLARKWIVCGFADLTGDKIQKEIWGRHN